MKRLSFTKKKVTISGIKNTVKKLGFTHKKISKNTINVNPKKVTPKIKKEKIKSEPKLEIVESGAKFLPVLKNSPEMRASKIALLVAEAIAIRAREVLTKQLFNWAPLSARYLEYKIDHHLDTRILIATQTYLKKIKFWVDGKNVCVGVKPGVIHKPSGMYLTTLARIHEYGTDRIPPRPLWRPILNEYMDVAYFGAIYRRKLKEELNKTKRPIKKNKVKIKKRKNGT